MGPVFPSPPHCSQPLEESAAAVIPMTKRLTGRLEVVRYFFNFIPDAPDILIANLFDIFFRITPLQQMEDEIGKLRDVLESVRKAVADAVIVRAEGNVAIPAIFTT